MGTAPTLAEKSRSVPPSLRPKRVLQIGKQTCALPIYFVVAGVDGPLSEFVRHQRHGDGAHAGGEIEIGAALAAPETRAVDAQAAHRGLLRHVVIGRGTGGAAAMVGGEGV